MRLDHSRAPLAEAVQAYRDADITPFTTPGHKRGRGIPPETATWLGSHSFDNDIPVASGADDTHLSRGVLDEAERLAADAYGADRCLFLLNGSTIGNQALILATCGSGDDVIVARNFHKSMLTGIILSGVRPVYVQPRYDPDLGVAYGVAPEDIEAALRLHPHARAVLLVSPSYFGVSSDLLSLADTCHAFGAPLIVDEAWGPHFPFHPELPPSAMASGADASVASIHKVLTGFTQSSVLNMRGELIDAARVASWVGLLQTTSPSAFILASIDACRRQMALDGRKLLHRTLTLAARAREAINAVPGLHAMGHEVVGSAGASGFDGTKLVVDVRGIGRTGYDADAWLRCHHRVTIEMSDHRRIVALLSIADEAESVQRLVDALVDLAGFGKGIELDRGSDLLRLEALHAEAVMTPREAYFAPARLVPLTEACSHVAAEVITPYPPGIPLLAPGEVITEAIVSYLREGLAAGMHITGAADPTLATLRVVR